MVLCAMISCPSHNKKLKKKASNGNQIVEKVHFYRFPRDKILCDIWVAKCQRETPFNVQNARICSLHFKEDDFERNLRLELLSFPYATKKILKAGSIPTDTVPSKSKCKKNPSPKKDERQERRDTRHWKTKKLTDICSVKGCKNVKGEVEDGIITFHLFPACMETRKAWIKFSQVDPEEGITTTSREICSDHFTDECFERDLKSELLYGVPKRKLLHSSIPTLQFKPREESVASYEKEVKRLQERRALVEQAIQEYEKRKAGVPSIIYKKPERKLITQIRAKEPDIKIEDDEFIETEEPLIDQSIFHTVVNTEPDPLALEEKKPDPMYHLQPQDYLKIINLQNDNIRKLQSINKLMQTEKAHNTTIADLKYKIEKKNEEILKIETQLYREILD